MLKEVENKTFKLKIKQVEFSLKHWQENPNQYNQKLLEVLHG
ncbi:hypothetical protein AB9T38_06735 [Campylobacter hepaticus]